MKELNVVVNLVRTTLLLNLILIFHTVCSDPGEILGCGGYVRSQYKLDFDKIEIKLFTKQGSLKLKTECAPTTGYYFIPLENKGEYVLKISSLESGWAFEPSEYAIKFDGKTDQCSQGLDINFDFKGFAVLGKVISAGFGEGPSGVNIALSGPDGLNLNTITSEGGAFAFESIPPGSYSLKAAHPELSFEKNTHTFEITNKNIVIDKQIAVNGYKVSGSVTSDKRPVEGVTLVLTSENSNVKVPKQCGTATKADLPSGFKGNVICAQKSDKTGVFTFSGVSPGAYSVVPVYKGQNTVYSVTPSHLKFDLGHSSLKLEPNFEVEGFTVQGRVKGLSGASILVDGEVKATSGHDGTFTLAKMKPGTYEFEVTAEKFQFDKISVTISATSPVIPDFVPARFLLCGKVNVFSARSEPQLSFVMQKKGETDKNQIIRQKIIDPNHFCSFFPEGEYSAWIESVPEKYFLPDKLPLKVPSGVEFSFKEFTGNIKGSVQCKLSNCDGIKVQVATQPSGHLIQEITLSNGQRDFKFENLASGVFSLKVIGEKFCWKEDVIENVQLKNANVENKLFVQTGIPLEIESSHETNVEVVGKNKAKLQQLSVKPGVPTKICLSDPDSTPESYTVKPVGCHEFEKAVYPFTVGKKINLVAKKHQYSYKIVSSAKIADLKLTRNGQSFTLDQIQKSDVGIKVKETPKNNGVEYEVSSFETAKTRVDWQVFSYGFIFEPNEFKIDTSDDCKLGVVRVLAKKSHVIQGKLTPPIEADIRIELIGDPDSTTYVSSNAAGEYIAGPFVHSSGFRVIPELPGYTFKPLANDAYSFTVHQLAKIQVKVQTLVGGTPSALASVLLSISGPNAYRQNKVTDANGEIVFGDLQSGQYYLKALLKEFRFEPSAVNIDLKEQETKSITLQANRESFSLYGQLTTLSGELLPNILVSAKGIGNCSEYGEEGTSDEHGNFRIWALKSYCNYEISLVKRDDFTQMVERTVPEKMDIKIGAEDVTNVSFVVITPVKRVDVSLRCYTNNDKSLDYLKAIVYSAKDPEKPLHTVPFNGISYIILPPLPKDGNEYIIGFEANINKFQYLYRLPPQINFTAESAYAHFKIQFNMEPAPVDQEIGKNSYIGFAVIMLFVLMIINYEKLGAYIKDIYENYASNSSGGVALKKTKTKTK